MDYENLFVFTVVCFYLWSLRSIFYWVRLWENVRYQPKRFVRSSSARRRSLQYLFSPSALMSWIGIIGALYITFDDRPTVYIQLAIFLIFLLKAVIVIKDTFTGKMLYPSFSLRSILIMISSTVTLSLLFMFPFVEKFLWVLILDRLLFFIVNGFVLFFSFPGEIADDVQVKKAMTKMHRQKQTLTILIAGSYHAKYVSHFLSQVLKTNYKVLTIHDEVLTQSQVAGALLRDLTPQTEVVIVSSEQAQDFSWIRIFFSPQILVILDPGKLGSFQKKEYLHSLLLGSHKKTKIFLDASLEKYMHGKRSKQLLSLFTSSKDKTLSGDRVVKVVENTQKKMSLDLTFSLRLITLRTKTPLIGSDYHVGLLLSAAIAHTLGFTQQKIKTAFQSLLPFPRKRIFHESSTGVMFVDNTANTDIQDTHMLLEYAALFKGSKFFVVGKESSIDPLSVKTLATQLASSTTHVLLLPSPYRVQLKKALKQKNNDCTVRELSHTQAISYLKDHVKRGDLILFEGEECLTIAREFYNSYASYS